MTIEPGKSSSGSAKGRPADFLRGGGAMGALMHAHDWVASPLGPPEDWPPSLRSVVRLMLATRQPMQVWWGADGACLYNDACRELIGSERHPRSLGRPAREVWQDIWHIVAPQIEQVMSGRGSTWNVDQLVPFTRNWRREDVCWTYSCSPIHDEASASGVGGVLVVCTETTQQVIAHQQLAAERDQLKQLFDQSPTLLALLRGPEHRLEMANPAYVSLIGRRQVAGLKLADALPDAVDQGKGVLLDRVLSSGEPSAGSGVKYTVPSQNGERAIERFVDFVYQPIKNADGQVTGIFVVGTDVTDRARADAALRESEARFRAALNAGRMGSWETDYENMTRTWSAEGMNLFGLRLRNGQGQVGGENDEYVRAIHPEDRPLAQQFRSLADQQDSFAAEYRIVKPNGSTLWLTGRGLVVDRRADGRAKRLISIMADASESKQAEATLRIERERLSLALNAGQMGAFDLNIPDETLWWSAQTFALFGMSPDSFVPTRESVCALIHPDDRAAFEQRRAEAIAQGRSFSLEFRVQTADGREVWLGYRGQAEYDSEGRPLRNFGIVMDISERKQFEQDMRDADRHKDEFIATLAHELRNPLAPIRNAVHLLKQSGTADPRALWCHSVIDRQSRQMGHLLDDLLDVSRMSRQQLKLQIGPLQLSDVIDQAVETAQPFIEASRHAFVINRHTAPLNVQGDPTRLAQVVSNVLINSAKYTPAGGKISLTTERSGSEAVIKVIDSGIGIAADHLPRIFEAFTQVDSALARAQGGQGIGLSLAKGLVELHGGTISARSAGAGLGSEFEIRLPLGSATRVPDPSRMTSPTHLPGDSRLRILIADDLRDIADSLALLLEDLGYEVHVAYDGEQALRLAEHLAPDVVLLDIGMPKVHGYDVCRQIRAAPWGDAMTLIAQTGWGQENDRLKTQEAGFDHHVTKPVQPDVLVSLFSRRGIESQPLARSTIRSEGNPLKDAGSARKLPWEKLN